MDYLTVENSRRSQRGATMVEYALIASLLAVVALFSVTQVGTRVEVAFDKAGHGVAATNIPRPDDPELPF